MGASAAKGAKIQGKNTTFQDIPGLGDIDFPLPEVEAVDVTSQDSPANTTEKIPTIFNAPVITVPITKWDDGAAMHEWLVTNNGTIQAFKYTGAGKPSGYAFNAIIKLSLSNPAKGAKSASLTLEVSDGNTPS